MVSHDSTHGILEMINGHTERTMRKSEKEQKTYRKLHELNRKSFTHTQTQAMNVANMFGPLEAQVAKKYFIAHDVSVTICCLPCFTI